MVSSPDIRPALVPWTLCQQTSSTVGAGDVLTPEPLVPIPVPCFASSSDLMTCLTHLVSQLGTGVPSETWLPGPCSQGTLTGHQLLACLPSHTSLESAPLSSPLPCQPLITSRLHWGDNVLIGFLLHSAEEFSF